MSHRRLASRQRHALVQLRTSAAQARRSRQLQSDFCPLPLQFNCGFHARSNDVRRNGMGSKRENPQTPSDEETIMDVQTKSPRPPLNGVDTPALINTINFVAGQPELAKFQFRAANEWIEGTHSRTSMQGFFGAGGEHKHVTTFFADGDHPTVLCGGDRAPTPVEWLLHGARHLPHRRDRQHRRRPRHQAHQGQVLRRRRHRPARHPRHLRRGPQRLPQHRDPLRDRRRCAAGEAAAAARPGPRPFGRLRRADQRRAGDASR